MNVQILAQIPWTSNITDSNAFSAAIPTQLIYNHTETIDNSGNMFHVKHLCLFDRIFPLQLYG